MKILGIDPGVHGALALFDKQLDSVRLLEVHDTPTVQVSVYKKTAAKRSTQRNEYDLSAIYNLLLSFGSIDLAVVEKIQPMPTNGSIGNFRSGYGFAMWVTFCMSMGIPLERVAPPTWKAALLKGLPKGKKSGLIKARELYPAAPLHLAGHDGRADAMLLATYGMRHLIGQSAA